MAQLAFFSQKNQRTTEIGWGFFGGGDAREPTMMRRLPLAFFCIAVHSQPLLYFPNAVEKIIYHSIIDCEMFVILLSAYMLRLCIQ